MKGDEEKIRQGGCEAYLSKPISVAKFFETIDHFLGPGAERHDSPRPRRRSTSGPISKLLEADDSASNISRS